MAATMVLTPQPAQAAVSINVNPDGRTLTRLQRYDTNGWNDVRTSAGLLPTPTPPVIVDYEPALDFGAAYRATFSDATSITSWVPTWDIDRPWLSVPLWPEKSVSVELITGYDATRRSGNVFHEVIDRVDPAVTLAPLRTRSGNLEIWCADYPTAAAVVAVHDLAQVCYLRQPDHAGMDMYYAVDGAINLAPYRIERPAIRWAVRIPFREVSRPTGNVIADVWDFDAVADEFTTMADLPVTFATFADLASNTRLP